MKKALSVILGVIMGFLATMHPGLAYDGQKKFSFKLKIGAGTSGDSDLGSYIKGIDDYGQDIAAFWGLQKSGDIRWTNMSRTLGGEFVWSITRRIGLGIGIDSMSKTKNNSADLGPVPFFEGDSQFDLKVIPLTFSAYYSFPISQGIRAYVKGGVGHYWGRIQYGLVSRAMGIAQNIQGDIKDRAFGPQGGVGIELRMSESITLFAEGSGRYVKFSSWEGDETETVAGISEKVEASPVWYVDEAYGNFSPGKYYPSINLGEKPVNNVNKKNARRFSVDFSGLTLQVGVKIGFGK